MTCNDDPIQPNWPMNVFLQHYISHDLDHLALSAFSVHVLEITTT